MRIFYLNRTEDESGVSGTGRIAQGFIFDNGKVCLTWLSEHPSVTIYDNIGEVRAIHGHQGKTELIMEPDYKRAFNELKSFVDAFSLSDIALEKLALETAAGKLLGGNYIFESKGGVEIVAKAIGALADDDDLVGVITYIVD